MEKLNLEKNSTERSCNISENVLNMYKINGYKEVVYKKYLDSKDLFESKAINSKHGGENRNLIFRTKEKILKQDKNEIASSIEETLQDNNIEIQRIGASLMQKVPENQREGLGELAYKKILDALNNQNIQIQRIGMNMVQFVPEKRQEELKKFVSNIIINTFNSNDIDMQRILAKKIDIAPKEIQDNLREIVYQKILETMGREDIRAQKLAATMIQYAPKNKQAKLKELASSKFELAKKQGKFDQIIEPPLYTESNESGNSVFSRGPFSKTGSEITLLFSKQFKNNLIIRHIEKPCFLAWEKAYESCLEWKKVGFDYVPIEPIYSFNTDRQTGLINVASGILDLNLEEWYAFSGNSFKEYLDIQKDKIIDTLVKLGINHGHPNDSNFCLRFNRDENGNVEINEVPRIYLIDFDKADQY